MPGGNRGWTQVRWLHLPYMLSSKTHHTEEYCWKIWAKGLPVLDRFEIVQAESVNHAWQSICLCQERTGRPSSDATTDESGGTP